MRMEYDVDTHKNVHSPQTVQLKKDVLLNSLLRQLRLSVSLRVSSFARHAHNSQLIASRQFHLSRAWNYDSVSQSDNPALVNSP